MISRLLNIYRRAADRYEFCLFLVVLFAFSLASATICDAGEVVLLRRSIPPVEEQQIRELANFYGLDLDTIDLDRDSVVHTISRLKAPHTIAVLIAQDALSALDHRQVQAAVQRAGGTGVPIMVFGIQAGKDTRDLWRWSGGRIRACVPSEAGFRPKALRVTIETALARTLAGRELPAVTFPTCNLQLEPVAKVQTVLAASGDSWISAALVRIMDHHSEVFFEPHMVLFDTSWVGMQALPQTFSSMAPFIVFLSYAAGEHMWHLDGQYANLTIDDAWLTEPYGHLNYMSLLAEMERHNFHTTIAFIPWNFNRSEPNLAALFRAHPERLSISIHGNNHAHREFGEYKWNPLEVQAADVKQGIARMEKFRALTGIAYDRIMIFPHGVAPAQTFALLKTYNFLGTANSVNVPMDLPVPTDPMFLLRPYTLDYGNFVSILRYSAEGLSSQFEIAQLNIAIQSFLGNPLLFYGHETLFQQGIETFDGFADFVNQLVPDTRWTSLGDVARHLHLIRRRDDGDFDVRMFSDEMVLNNPTQRNAVFHVEREVGPSPRIRTLMIDGESAPFERSGNTVTLYMSIAANRAKNLQIIYENDLDLQHQEIRKTSIYVFSLRMASDFRDLYLSRIPLGTFVTRSYYRYGLNSVELGMERNWQAVLAVLGVMFVGLLFLHRRNKNSTRQKIPPRA